ASGCELVGPVKRVRVWADASSWYKLSDAPTPTNTSGNNTKTFLLAGYFIVLFFLKWGGPPIPPRRTRSRRPGRSRSSRILLVCGQSRRLRIRPLAPTRRG